MLLNVTPNFPASCFVYSWSGAPDVRALRQLDGTGAEIGTGELRVPFDPDAIRAVTARLKLMGCNVVASETAREVFRYLNVQRDHITWKQRPDLDLPDDLYPHQNLAISWLLHRDCAGLFVDLGLGKTRCAIHAVQLRGVHAVVIAPKSVIGLTWRPEIERWLGRKRITDDEVEGVFMMRGTARRKDKALADFRDWIRLRREPGFLLTNYETLLRRSGDLGKCGAQMLILDESTYVRTPNAQRTKNVEKISERFRYRVILTGQPMTQGPEDLFAQVRFLDKTVFGTRVDAFRARYFERGISQRVWCPECSRSWREIVPDGSSVRDLTCEGCGGFVCSVEGPTFPVITGYRNLSELSEKVFSICLQLDKKWCLPNCPEKVYQVREIEMSREQRKAYDQMAEEFAATLETEGGDVEKIARGVLSQIGALQQITSGFVYVDDGRGGRSSARFKRSPKIEEIVSILTSEAASRKAVIWCQFREEVDWVVERLREELDGQDDHGSRDGGGREGADVGSVRVNPGRRGGVAGSSLRVGQVCSGPSSSAVVWIDGRTSDEDRQVALETFQTEPHVRVMVAQQASVSHGVTMHAADLAIYLGNAWSLEKRLQSEGRIDRIGQKSSQCVYVDLICPGTVDVAVLEALRRKADVAGIVTRKRWERLVKGESE